MTDNMKKQYKTPALSIVKIGIQPLMVLSENTPETKVNHEEYNEEFGTRRLNSVWDDEDDEDF